MVPRVALATLGAAVRLWLKKVAAASNSAPAPTAMPAEEPPRLQKFSLEANHPDGHVGICPVKAYLLQQPP